MISASGLQIDCTQSRFGEKLSVDQNKERVRRRAMGKQDNDYDYHRYKKPLAEAVDESKRLDLIDVLIEEKARTG